MSSDWPAAKKRVADALFNGTLSCGCPSEDTPASLRRSRRRGPRDIPKGAHHLARARVEIGVTLPSWRANNSSRTTSSCCGAGETHQNLQERAAENYERDVEVDRETGDVDERCDEGG